MYIDTDRDISHSGPYFNLVETCRLIGCDHRTLQKAVRRDEIEAYRLPRGTRRFFYFFPMGQAQALAIRFNTPEAVWRRFRTRPRKAPLTGKTCPHCGATTKQWRKGFWRWVPGYKCGHCKKQYYGRGGLNALFEKEIPSDPQGRCPECGSQNSRFRRWDRRCFYFRCLDCNRLYHNVRTPENELKFRRYEPFNG